MRHGRNSVTNWLLAAALCTGASVGSARAQKLTIADLDGLVIESTITREQVNRVQGRAVTTIVDQTSTVEIGPLPSLKSTMRQQPRGRPDVPTMTATFQIGEARQVGSFGGGDGEWTFEADTLTFTRSFKQGAYRFQITLVRKDNGYDCGATVSFAREDGTGQIVSWSPMLRSDVEITDWRQLSSTCRVSKK
jgi:hypothetical protein